MGGFWQYYAPPPPRGAAWAVDGWLGEDGEGGGKGWLGSQRCQIGGAQATAEWDLVPARRRSLLFTPIPAGGLLVYICPGTICAPP